MRDVPVSAELRRKSPAIRGFVTGSRALSCAIGIASLIFAKESDTTIHVDLPPDFDLPLSEESPESNDEGTNVESVELPQPKNGETTA